MSKESVFLERWFYFMPDTKPAQNGRIVLIKKRLFGPLETYDFGIDANGLPYEEYQWCENDWFKDENYFQHISKIELTEQIKQLISKFTDNKLYEWASTYKKILDWLNSN